MKNRKWNTHNKYEYLELKILKNVKDCESSYEHFPCDLCEIIFKTECKLDAQNAGEHTNKEGNFR